MSENGSDYDIHTVHYIIYNERLVYMGIQRETKGVLMRYNMGRQAVDR